MNEMKNCEHTWTFSLPQCLKMLLKSCAKLKTNPCRKRWISCLKGGTSPKVQSVAVMNFALSQIILLVTPGSSFGLLRRVHKHACCCPLGVDHLLS